MSLESATFIDELDTNNPTTTDPKAQGDDHFRLLKGVLKNSIKRVTRAFYVPGTVAKSANYTVLATDDNKTFICDTTTAFTLTMPSLVSADAGWCIYVLKTTSDANPVWIAPPSGTINGYTKVRRSVAHHEFKVLWTGSVFSVQRQFGVPIGSFVEHYGASLPQGTLWPDGTTFTAADYVELNSILSGNTKPDVRERFKLPLDNSAGVTRVTTAGSGIDGNTKGATGGAQGVVVEQANLTPFTLPNTISIVGGTDVIRSANAVNDVRNDNGNQNGVPVSVSSDDLTIGGSVTSGGSSIELNKMPPSIVVPCVLVAE